MTTNRVSHETKPLVSTLDENSFTVKMLGFTHGNTIVSDCVTNVAPGKQVIINRDNNDFVHMETKPCATTGIVISNTGNRKIDVVITANNLNITAPISSSSSCAISKDGKLETTNLQVNTA